MLKPQNFSPNFSRSQIFRNKRNNGGLDLCFQEEAALVNSCDRIRTAKALAEMLMKTCFLNVQAFC